MLSRGQTLSGLVNNAGVASIAPLMHHSIPDILHELDVNVVGALRVIQVTVFPYSLI